MYWIRLTNQDRFCPLSICGNVSSVKLDTICLQAEYRWKSVFSISTAEIYPNMARPENLIKTI